MPVLLLWPCNDALASLRMSMLLQAPAAIQLIGTEGESAEFILGEQTLSWIWTAAGMRRLYLSTT